MAPPDAGRRRAARSASPPISAKLAVGGVLLAAVRDLDRQDARVPRAGLPRRRADARPARHAAAVRVAELLMSTPHLRRRASAGRLAGAGELPAALPGPALRAAQRLRAARAGAGAVGRLAGLHPGRAAPLHHRGASRCCSRPSSSRSRCTGSIVRLGIHREIETVVGIGPTMLLGMGLVALSMVVMLRGHAPAPIRWRARTSPSRWRSCCSAC